MDNEKDLAIIGSKGKGGGGSSYRAPVEEPDTLQSTQIVTIVDAISEGPIEGLVDGDKGIALNYTPLRTPDGTLTYQNVSWDSRLGTPDQEAYTDIAGAEAERTVGVEVTNLFPKKVGPGTGSVTRQLTNTNATDVRITLMVQDLYEQKLSGDNVGDTVAASVSYRIQIKNKNGAIIADKAETKTDKTTSSAQWCLKFALDRNGPWTITVYKTSEDSDKSNIKTDLYWSSYTEIVGYPMVYPHTATVMLRGSAETFGGSVPSRAYHVKGLRIEVPSNYDPETRTYTGIWDGSFKLAWTDNPAWILRDLIQSNRYGLRKFFPPAQQGRELVDKWTLYQLAQYCDQLVPDGEGGSEPRYTFNGQIMGSGEAREVLQSIASVFHGMTYWSSGMIFARADMPTDPVKLISHANAINGLLTYSTGSAQERHSVALVTWYDPDDYGRARVEPVYDWDAYTRYGYRPVQVTAYGCTSRGQAYRQGLWTLLTEDEQWQCTVEVGLDCYDLLPGDFVKVADPTAMGVRYTGRIKSVSGKTVVLDAPVTLAQNETYELGIVMPDGMEEKRTVVTRGTTDTLTVSTAYSHTPVESALWVISGTDAAPRLFAVRSITEKSGDSAALELSLREVHLSKYAQLEGGLVLPETPGRITKSSLALPSGLNVTETTYTSNGLPIQRLTFAWAATGDPEVSMYEPQYKAPNGSWTNYQAQKSFSIDVPVAAPGDYLFRVRSVATDGRVSGWAEISYRSTGTTTGPKPIANLRAKGGQNSVLVSWTIPQDALAGYYEVWMSDEGEDESTARLMAKIYADNFTVSGLDASTPYWFWVRTVSIVGQAGEMVGPVGAVTEAIKPPDLPDGVITRPHLDDVLNTNIDFEQGILDYNAEIVALNAVDEFNERILTDGRFADVSEEIKTNVDDINGSIAELNVKIQSQFDNAAAQITENRQTIAKNDYATAKRIDTVQTQVNANTAGISSNQTAIASLTETQAEDKETLLAQIGANTSAIQTTNTALSNLSSSTATSINTLQTKVNNNTAAIQTNSEAISDLNTNKASASSVSNLTTKVNNNTSAIQTNATAISTLNGECEAQYTLRTDVNGRISGFGLWNNGSTSEFVILADRFIVAGPNDTGAGTQVFTVDAATGAVVINGNLFVDSAGKANSGWIRGSMIYAKTKIELADGAIVLDGTKGVVTVFDPANLTNGNYMTITSGYLRQYKNHSLARALANVETGTCQNGTWYTLANTYSSKPEVSISPCSIQTYSAAYSSQSQTLTVGVVSVESLGNGEYRFKPEIKLTSESATASVTPLPALIHVDENGIGAGNRWDISGETHTEADTAIVYGPANVILVRVTVRIYTGAIWAGYWVFGKHTLRWRVAYRISGTTTWNYDLWNSDITINSPDDLEYITRSTTVTLSAGQYEFLVHFECDITGSAGRYYGTQDNGEPSIEITEIIVAKAGGTQLATGTVNFIAIGE